MEGFSTRHHPLFQRITTDIERARTKYTPPPRPSPAHWHPSLTKLETCLPPHHHPSVLCFVQRRGLPLHHYPSLAHNTRQRGVCYLTTTPPSRKGVLYLATTPTRETEGSQLTIIPPKPPSTNYYPRKQATMLVFEGGCCFPPQSQLSPYQMFVCKRVINFLYVNG